MRTILIAAALSLPLVAVATTPTLAANYGPSANGGGSTGYNHGLATYRLKKHHPVTGKKLHNQVKPKKTSAKSAKPKS